MASRTEVAIVGYAGRLPGAQNVNAFWSLLRDNRCSVDWITRDRFPTDAFYHPSPGQSGRSYTFAAGLIDDVWGFDAAAFGMSPREAEQVDPQQRHLLEVTHDALAHAGIRPSMLAGSHTGVYVGASSVDYGARFFADPSAADVHMMTGNTLSIIANRLSYALNAHGPSFTVDTACSSSLVALSLAADAIRNGSIDTAIVGGANLLLSPFSFVGFSRASMLSPTGLCRPFDAAADGYVRAEGIVVLVLRSLAASRKASNRIHATILGSAVGQDGRTTGLSLPSASSQKQLLEQVYGDFAIDPADLSFVEAHGTGTKVGDPIEADALGKGLAQRRSQPLPIGSVKSNIGHLEPASGLAGVLKSILALNYGMVPATLHQKSPNTDIPFDELNLRVVERNWSLPERRGPSLAGVNSFGFGGTNAHVILRGEDTTVTIAYARGETSPPPLLLSAHSADSLKSVAARQLEHWPPDRRRTNDFISAAAHLRDALPHRAILLGRTSEQIRNHLEQFSQGKDSASILTGQALGANLPVAYLFSGNGSQWAGMGRAAWHANSRFRDALKEVDDHFVKRQSGSLVDLLFADDLAPKLRRATYAQPLLLGLQVATVRALEHHGIAPISTLGHSVGEIAAAWCAGALGLEQAIDVVIARSRHLESVRGLGAMAALMLSERETRRFLAATKVTAVDIAAINSWHSVTVSGPVEEVERVLGAAAHARIGALRLDLDYPYHSALVDPVRAPLQRELAGLKSLPTRRHFISSTTGTIADQDDLGPEHWWRNMREPVRFEAGLAYLLNEGVRVFVEIGPKPILASYVRDALRDASVRGCVVQTLTEAQETEDGDPIERAVSRVFIAGGQVDSQRFFGPPPAAAVPLPLYPWRHTQFKVQPTAEAATTFFPPKHPLLGSRPRQDSMEWFSTVDPVLFPWIADHVVGGIPVFPAAAYIEAMLAVARESYPDSAIELREMDIVRPLIFDGTSSFETVLRLAHETSVVEFLSRPRGSGADWALNARGIISRSPLAERREVHGADTAGTVIVPKAKVYEVSRGLGFDYGPSFQRIRYVSFPEPKRAVAMLERDVGVELPGAVIDLTGLDAAFHALFASEEAGVADMPMKRMLPIRFGRVRVYSPGAMATCAISRTLHQSLSSIVADIELLDAAGKVILSADSVRVIEAPVAPSADPRALTYRTTTWCLERAGKSSEIVLEANAAGQADTALAKKAAEVREALLLLEAGCLRQTWSAFRAGASKAVGAENPPSEDDAEWPAYLVSSLLWHLETKNLVKEQQGELALAETCDLPTVTSVIRSLLARHPTMAAEAAGLSRLGDIIDRLVAGDSAVHADLASAHWRQLDVASEQISLLRKTVTDELTAALRNRKKGQLVRLLLAGAHHSAVIAEEFRGLSGIEVVITDRDSDRLEQARAALGDDAPHIRCVPWSELDAWPAATFDLAGAIDALSEIAATGDGLGRLKRLMRPNAPIVAGEPAPSLFWDLVRGIRPTWWARSANSEFPVGALLTNREWLDELETAGFVKVTGQPILGEESIGVVLHGIAGSQSTAADGSHIERVNVSWEGDETPNISALQALLRVGPGHSASADAGGSSKHPAIADVIWTVDVRMVESASASSLGGRLAQLADRCQRLATAPARLWVLADFGIVPETQNCLEQPIWCALTAALRVAQNEYAGLEIRCIGLSGAEDPSLCERVAEEITSLTDEREIYFHGAERIVFRIERGVSEPSSLPARSSEPVLKLSSRSASSRGSLVWVPDERRSPEPEEVEIEVMATGLNFRDVMWNLGLLPEEALEDGYAGSSLGMECAGIVSAVGEGVRGPAIGDRVMAFVSAGFSTHVVAPAFAVRPMPVQLTFEAAASLPVAFLTAYYSLVHLGGLKRGETILIHGGAGAVGLAALQIAQYCGASVIATAGSEEKRALLRDLGVAAVFNSRTLAFADDVLAYTGDKGVDVVLNSLAGEAMVRSMDCLRPFGRFIELGKRDFYANTHLGLRPFRRNLAYFGVDIDQLIIEHRDLTQRLFSELLELFSKGELAPLPHRIFAGEYIFDAFRFMQRSGHIGKIVITPATRPTEAPQSIGRFPVSTEGLHVVIGGTSGFGLATAEWLVERGARHLALVSRAASLSDEAKAEVDKLRDAGAKITVAAVDVTDLGALQRFFQKMQASIPINGIVHAAMVLEDRLIEGLDQESIEKVLQPKVQGALNLERLCRDLPLDYLLLYSSATTLLGNPGQFNYVAANAYMEGVAQRARADGLPALAVAWGGIEDVGYLAKNINASASLKKRFATSLVTARVALDALDLAFDAEGRPKTAFLSIAQIDWAMARRELAATRAPKFAAVIPGAGARQTTDAAATLEKLRTMSLEDASAAMLEIVVDEIARVLRLLPKEVDRHRPLADIGMDSLMMLELRATVETGLQIQLPMMSLANGITPSDIARRVAGLIIGASQQETVPGHLMALSASHMAANTEATDSDEQLAAARAILERSRTIEGPL